MNSILSVALMVSLSFASVPVTAQQLPEGRMELESNLVLRAARRLLPPTQPMQVGTSHDAMTHDVSRGISQSGVAVVIQASKRDGAVVRLLLRDDSQVVGLVGDCQDDRFDLIQAGDRHDVIRFDQIAALLELETGQVVSTVGQGGIGGVGKPSVKTTVIVMVAVAAALILFWSTIPK